jgi:hypothetical protein
MKNVNESSLSRIYRHSQEHDTGFITAFRYARDCGKGVKYTKDENLKRNKSLLAKLQSKRYGVTAIKGRYIEGYGTPEEKEVGENVFFVVDLNDTGNLLKDLKKLGIEFDQDTILFVPEAEKESQLHGTNYCVPEFLKFGQVKKLTSAVFGEKGIMYSRVNGRPFVFKELDPIQEEYNLPQGFAVRWIVDIDSKKHWSKLEL